MGWDDWTWEEESEEGMVRGYCVQWHRDPNFGLVVYDDDDDEALYVFVTGELPAMRIEGQTTVGEASDESTSSRYWRRWFQASDVVASSGAHMSTEGTAPGLLSRRANRPRT